MIAMAVLIISYNILVTTGLIGLYGPQKTRFLRSLAR